jgi:electron transport complex protein RnfE
MGLATTFVLVMSNLVISLVKSQIPDKVRIPAFIVIIAAFVTVVELVMQAYTPGLFKSLGIFIPLIVVNCIVLGRAEAFASKNNPLSSVIDGLGMGLGFTGALVVLGSIREILGSGTLFSFRLYPENYTTLLFVLAPGAFIVLGYLIAIVQKINKAQK